MTVRGAIFDRTGALKFVSETKSERDTWDIYLGWPDAEGIVNAKFLGDRFALVDITERPALTDPPRTGRG